MKKLKYIYLLLIAMLLGFAISSCEDDDVVVGEDDDEEIVGGGSGEMISTTFTVGISAPNVSGDLDVATRADADNANIEYANLENGGRFQNLIVVLTNQEDTIKGVECKNWSDGVGVKEYTAIFPDIKVFAADVTNNKQYKVYAFGNVCNDHFDAIKGESTGKVGTNVREWENLQNNCIKATISVDDVYNIDFTPGTEKYKIGDDYVISAGMPVNNSASATVVKGNTQFTVAMKRVCARLQVTFRNFTGTYKVYGTEDDEPNNVYVDKFEIKNVLANKANYFCNNNTSVTDVTSSNFDILKALGGATATNDHKINKIENGKDTTISMYIFENNKGGYTYDLKVDRGKSLGLNTTKIDTANAYVIWNNEKNNSIAYIGGEICASREQTSKDNIPFSDQVFWKLEIPKSPKVENPSLPYMLRHLEVDEYDRITMTNDYFAHQNEKEWDKNDPSLVSSLTTISEYPQYIQLRLQSSANSISYYTISLLNSKYTTYGYINPTIPYDEGKSCWGKASRVYGERYYYLSVDSNNNLCKSRSELFSGSSGLKYEWTLYAKYIIKNNQQFKDNDGAITQIDRNHSYELDFSVMPNYETKQELLVKCVRKQNEVNWSEVQK